MAVVRFHDLSCLCRWAMPERLMAMPVVLVFFQQNRNAPSASRLKAMAMRR